MAIPNPAMYMKNTPSWKVASLKKNETPMFFFSGKRTLQQIQKKEEITEKCCFLGLQHDILPGARERCI